MRRGGILLITWLCGLAAASPASELFEDASALFAQHYYGWQTANRPALIERYRQQLQRDCRASPRCSYDVGRRALQKMFSEFNDAHITVRDAEGAQRLREIQENLSVPRTGLQLLTKPQGLLVVGVQRDSPAEAAGLRAGDLLRHVNAQSAGSGGVDDLTFTRLERKGQALTLSYERRGQVTQLRLQPRTLPSRDALTLNYPAEKTALIQLGSFLPQDSAALFLEKVKEAQSAGAHTLIIDLRYNGGGRLDQCVAAASIFKPVLYQARFSSGAWAFAGARGQSVLPLSVQSQAPLWAGRAAVLIGPDTASCAEVFAYYAQKNGAVLIGAPTKGLANSGVNFFPLPDHGVLSLTTLRAYDEGVTPLPSKIRPDILAPTNFNQLVSSGLDSTLQAALNALQTPPALPMAQSIP